MALKLPKGASSSEQGIMGTSAGKRRFWETASAAERVRAMWAFSLRDTAAMQVKYSYRVLGQGQ